MNLLDNAYGDGRHISFQEIGTYTTQNIGPISTISFSGTAFNDATLAVTGPKE